MWNEEGNMRSKGKGVGMRWKWMWDEGGREKESGWKRERDAEGT
jgi:hypothetical protein